MKEHVQKTGVRKYAGDDLIELQSEPLKALQGFFAEYGACIVQGVSAIPAEGENKYNITPGLLALGGTDADGADTFKIVPFSGVEDVTLPLYFTFTHTVSERVYGDGKVKPIAYNYHATASAISPADGVPCLELTASGGCRFIDAINLSRKLDKDGNGKDVTVTFAEAAGRVNVASGEKLSALFGKVRKWLADLKTVAFTGKAADLETDTDHQLVTAAEKNAWADKYTRALTYTRTEIEQKIADVVSSAPETLDTLQELAAALGNDPNFATSIMALIGGKADTVHSHTIANVTNLQGELNKKLTVTPQYAGDVNTLAGSFIGKLYDAPNAPYNFYPFFSFGYDQYRAQFNTINNSLKFRSSNHTDGTLGQWVDIWHSGNLNPDNIHMANKQTLISNVNLNTLTTEGTYNFQTANGTGNVGIPEGVPAYGTLVVNNGGSFICQTYVAYVGIVSIRSRSDNGTWSAWTQLATTGQLAQKADKNHTHPGNILCTGKANRNGGPIFITPGFAINRMEKGLYRIRHAIGHTNYGLIGTGFDSNQNAPTMIGMKTCAVDYCDVCSYSGGGGLQDSEFSFTIFGQ